MDYHSHKFADSSLMIYEGKKLVALLPANIESDQLISHGGLTFGGLIIDGRMSVSLMLKIFDEIINYIKDKDINHIVYKRVPYIYHSFPSEEDLYALFIKKAKLYRRDISSAIYLKNPVNLRKDRIRAINKAKSFRIDVRESNDFSSFWNILRFNLKQRYDKKPVHSLQEMLFLHRKFPKNIKLFASYMKGTMVAGTIIYESSNVAHLQYSARDTNNIVKGSLDILISYLIEKYSLSKSYFDFGISTEQDGLYLNKNLISFKEGFGAKAIAYDFYRIDAYD